MTNLCCVSVDNIDKLKQFGVFKLIKYFIEDSKVNTFGSVLWCVNNLIFDNRDFKLYLQNNGTYKVILAKFRAFNEIDEVREHFSAFVKVFCENEEPIGNDIVG